MRALLPLSQLSELFIDLLVCGFVTEIHMITHKNISNADNMSPQKSVSVRHTSSRKSFELLDIQGLVAFEIHVYSNCKQ